MSTKRFPWGKVVDLFVYDFDGKSFEAIKYHPWIHDGQRYTSDHDESRIHWYSEELGVSVYSLESLLVCWVAKQGLGIQGPIQVAPAICRALNLE